MILRALRVSGFRCFATEVKLEGLRETLNVVHAPNGTGKSTLFEALRRALVDSYSVSSREAEAMRPWGRDLAPTVLVEFAHLGEEFRLEKRFLSGGYSKLARREGLAWAPLATGAASDERVRAMIPGASAGRGLAKAAQWGIAQVLWAPQGALGIEGPLPSVAVDAVRAALGAQVAHGAGAALRARIEARYLELFAPQTGKLRTGKGAPALVRAEQAAAELRVRLAAARGELAELTQASERVGRLREERARAAVEAVEAREALRREREDSAGTRVLRVEMQGLAARVEGARARHEAQRARAESNARAERERADARARHARCAAELPEREHDERDAEARAERARARRGEVRAARRGHEQLRTRAERAERFVRAREALGRMAERARAAGALREELSHGREARGRLLAPDAATLERARSLRARIERAEARWRGGSVELEWLAERDGTARVLVGQRDGHEEPREGASRGAAEGVRAGARVLVRGAGEVVLELPGIGRVRARLGDEQSAKAALDAEQALHAARAELASLLAPFRTHDEGELEARRARAEALDRAVTDTEARLRAEASRDHAEERAREEARRAVEEALGAEPAWADEPPDAAALREEATRAAREGAALDEESEAELDAATAALGRARESLHGARARSTEAERAVRTREQSEAAEPVDEATLAATALEYDAARAALDEARARHAGTASALRTEAEERATLAKLEARERECDERAQRALSVEKTEEGRLAHLAETGPYSRVAALEEELARHELEVRRERSRADAVKLLRTEVERCALESMSAVSPPVEREAAALLGRFSGLARFEALSLDANLNPARVRPSGAAPADGVSLDAISGGEREQVFLAARLALASVLSEGDRQLVVLDDALTFTDDARHGRVLEVLRELSQHRVQVVVLTCHPSRYAALTDAEAARFDLARTLSDPPSPAD